MANITGYSSAHPDATVTRAFRLIHHNPGLFVWSNPKLSCPRDAVALEVLCNPSPSDIDPVLEARPGEQCYPTIDFSKGILNVTRPTLIFADVAMAAEIDRAEGGLCAQICKRTAQRRPEKRAIARSTAAGVAAYAGPGAPSNKVIGIGLGQPLDESRLAAIDRKSTRLNSSHIPLSRMPSSA